ncbi:hypothetical protein [Microcella putealis]|nr:hypothetical protein [Microcella putealis]
MKRRLMLATHATKWIRGTLAISCVLLLAGVTGCSASDDTVPAPVATSERHAAELRAACLTERGWDVVVAPDNAVAAEIPADQMDVYVRDSEECGEGLAPDRQSFTTEQWGEWYALAIEAADCLADEGFAVDDRPSLQAFTDANGDWSPHIALFEAGLISSSQIENLRETCPQPIYYG